jgi:hypothetical protein
MHFVESGAFWNSDALCANDLGRQENEKGCFEW